MSASRRCLLIEALPQHWEVLPHWVAMLNAIGYEVEVATDPGVAGHEQTLAQLKFRCRVHDVADIDARTAAAFSFVVLNSTVHEGYFYKRPPATRPNLPWLRSLDRPSISVVHEPVHWVEKSVTASFLEFDGARSRILNLLGDGCFQYEHGFWSARKWSIVADTLSLPEQGRVRRFHTADQGRTYSEVGAPEGSTLVRRDLPDEDPANHVSDGRHAIVTLTESGAEHLKQAAGSVPWILPLAIEPRAENRAEGAISFAGLLDYDRKSLHSLLRDCHALGDGRTIEIIGGSLSSDFENDHFVQVFKGQLREKNLESRFSFTGYLPYGEYLARVRQARFLIPLVDDIVDSGSYLVKLPAAISCSLGFGIPLIVNRDIAERFGMEYMICYAKDDLASGLMQERQLTKTQYEAMLATLDRHAQAIYRRNLDELRRLVDRITRQEGKRTDAAAQ